MEKEFIQNAEKTGIKIDAEKMAKLQSFYEMLYETNKSMNLTAITDYKEVLYKHFLDSLLVIKALKEAGSETGAESLKRAKVADIGTGAGFPGIPLKICFPDMRLTLIDSLNKRIGFLKGVCESLGLTEVTPVHGRSEELGQDPAYRGQYDLVLSRAVASLPVLCEYCIPFVKKGGLFVAYKAEGVSEEVKTAGKAVKLLGGETEGVISVSLEGTDIIRDFVIIRKTADTPKKYPRKPGTPAKEPLK